MDYRIVYPAGLDDSDWGEISAKGWLEGVKVVTDRAELTVAVFDESRLVRAIGVDFRRIGYFAIRRLLVVPDVTREYIESAVASLAKHDFLDLQ